MDAVDQGWQSLQDSRWDDAIIVFDRALAAGPVDAVRALVGRAVALRMLGRAADAVEDLTVAVSLDPRRADAYHERGIALMILGRLQEALKDLDRAVVLEPTATALSDRGGLLARLGRHADAIVDLRRALELQPDFAEAHYNLGSVRAQSGDLRSAAVSFRAAVRLGLARAEDRLLRARRELYVQANDDGSMPVAVEALLDARSVDDVEELVDRFPFMVLPEVVEVLESGLAGLGRRDAAILRQRLDALRRFVD